MLQILLRTWARRYLVKYMVLGQLRGDAALQFLGYVWWVLEPLALTATFTFLIAGVFRRGGPELPYLLMAGILPWRWTSSATSEAIGSIRRSSGILLSGYLPKTVFPLVALGVSGVRFVVALAVVAVVIFLLTPYGDPAAIWLPGVVGLHALFNLGLALVLSHFGTYIPDTKNFWQVFSRVWFYLSPIMYETPRFSPKWQFLYGLNPAVGLIELYRWALLGHAPPRSEHLLSLCLFTLLSLLWGLYLHARHDQQYAKVI